MIDGDVQSLSILLIEDNPGDRRLAEIALRQGALGGLISCQVQSAASLAEGLKLLTLAERGPDAVLLDLGLPDATGLDGLHALANAKPDIAIVVLSGHSDLQTATEALKHGASDYLEKMEIQPRTLLRAIRYAIERKKTEAELKRLARLDSLTGLPNRRVFFDQLEFALAQARRSRHACAVILFDVDNFKEVNDLLGHKAGDDLLVAIAGKVRGQLRQTDSLSRLGGDEFAVIAPILQSPAVALEMANRISRAVKTIEMPGSGDLVPGISVGVSVFPNDNVEAELLVSHADMAMYRSKSAGKGAVTFFDSGMDESVKARHLLRRAITADISEGRFSLLFQPIVAARSRRLSSAEGLARWRYGTEGSVAPAQFIPIAEESGVIGDLGEKLLDEACGQIRKWSQGGLSIVPVSLNISTIQLRDPAFGLQLIGRMEKFGLAANSINIEITEAAILKYPEMAERNLQLLKRYGVGAYIDDFGSSYSSLPQLKGLAIDGLKIAERFIRNIGRDAEAVLIPQAVVAFSRKLGLLTIAKGVEREEQALALCEMGVDFLQGFLFSRPLEADAFAKALAEGGETRAAGQEAARRR